MLLVKFIVTGDPSCPILNGKTSAIHTCVVVPSSTVIVISLKAIVAGPGQRMIITCIVITDNIMVLFYSVLK